MSNGEVARHFLTAYHACCMAAIPGCTGVP